MHKPHALLVKTPSHHEDGCSSCPEIVSVNYLAFRATNKSMIALRVGTAFRALICGTAVARR
jgi:hypothetical protein